MAHLILSFVLLFQVGFIFASPAALKPVPESLKPWVDWVLHDNINWQCPFFYHNFKQKHCLWPGRLSLDMTTKQARFTSYWQVFKPAWVELPGDDRHWPQDVKVNGLSVVVIKKQEKPVVWLMTGQYQITGHFVWQQLPKTLAIPRLVGLIDVNVNHKPIDPVIKKNTLWLKPQSSLKPSGKHTENTQSLQVYRKIKDSIPLQLISRFELNIAGQSREVKLPNALLNQFIPVSLDSPLPTRLEADGSLTLRARPGHWVITLIARYPGQVNQLKLDIEAGQWSKPEIWSFQPQTTQRIVEITGVPTLDPRLTNMPKKWQRYRAYQVKPGDQLKFKLIRRGDPEPEPNQLTLKRRLWLDFSGQSYTVSDTLAGNLTQGWRLNVLPEMTLGQVKLNGENQLITYSIEGYQGVEVRTGRVSLQADSRLEKKLSQFHVTGWQQSFSQVSAELNLPPGWQLFAASGMDNNPDTWLTHWSLLDLFLVLIASLAVARLWSVYWGLFALLTLTLCWHENQAPHLIWLHLLATIALLKVIPESKLRQLLQGYRYLCSLLLIIIIVPFMVSQVRTGLYPQLEKPGQTTRLATSAHYDKNISQDITAPRKTAMEEVRRLKKRQSSYLSSTSIAASPSTKRSDLHIDPDANIQTGPGLPQWQWQRIHFSWNSSVDPQQQLRLWYLSPGQSMLINFLQVILILILSGLMFNLFNQKIKWPFSLSTCLLMLGLFTVPSPDAQADFPPPELLKTLKERLLQAPECLPACGQITIMTIQLDTQSLIVNFQLHAQHAILIPLPARYSQWIPNQITVDGQPATGIIKTATGQLWLGVEAGQHTVQLSGVAPLRDQFVLPLKLKPHQLTPLITGWQLSGAEKNAAIESQLIFSRKRQRQKPLPEITSTADLPAFIQVERSLHLGLDWYIITRVKRVVNNGSAVALSIPLIDNESVITDDMNIKKRRVLIHLLPHQESRQWQSILKKSDQIILRSEKTDQWMEVWKLDVSPIWHVEISGIPVVYHQNRGRKLLEWHPWQSEQIALEITRPKAIKGQTLTIDYSRLKLKVGKRSIDSELTISIRSSQGTQYRVELPKQVNVQTVKINGISQPIRQQNNQLVLPIKPGQQELNLTWRKIQSLPIVLTTPLINLGFNSVNSDINVILPGDRWILWVSGSHLGPAVLFWGMVIVIMLISFALGKTTLTPLKSWQWFLLLIGLSQIPVELAIFVVIWLLALGFRAQQQPCSRWAFNLLQITLGGLTLVSLALLFFAVQQGLLGSPDMQIAGNHSSAFNLNWYQDHASYQLPIETVITVPLISYRILMLLWALWLAVSLLNWLKWGWLCFSCSGLWKKQIKKPSIIQSHQDRQVK